MLIFLPAISGVISSAGHVFLTECVWVKVIVIRVLTIKGSIYHVPNSPVSYYENILHDLDLIFSHGHNMIVMGKSTSQLTTAGYVIAGALFDIFETLMML